MTRRCGRHGTGRGAYLWGGGALIVLAAVGVYLAWSPGGAPMAGPATATATAAPGAGTGARAAGACGAAAGAAGPAGAGGAAGATCPASPMSMGGVPAGQPQPIGQPELADPAVAAAQARQAANRRAGAAAGTAPAAAPTPATSAATGAGSGAPAADQVLALINQARAQAGLATLVASADLDQSASAHNQTMAGGCGLSHQCAGEPAVGDRESAAGVDWTAAGENIGEDGPEPDTATAIAQTAVALTQDMLNEKPPDDGHRRNILSSSFGHVGIAVYEDSAGTVWMTQDFSN